MEKYKVLFMHAYSSKRNNFFCIGEGTTWVLIQYIGLLFAVNSFRRVLFWENVCFSGPLQPDWGNTAWEATARLGSIGLKKSLCRPDKFKG